MKRNISILLAQCYIQSVTAFSLSSIHFAYYERNPVRTWARRASSTYANKPDSAASPSAEPNDALQLTRAIGQPAWKGSKLKKGTRTRTFTRRKMDPNRKEAGSWYQRDEMMQHDILTKDLETDLGQKVVLAKKLREKMINLIEKKEELQFGKTWDARGSTSFMDQRGLGYDDDGMEFMSIYENTSGDFDEPSMESWKESLENYNFQGDQRISSTLVRDGSKLSVSAFESDLELLTEEDIIVKLKVPGGKEELRGILFVGAESRTMLMRSNIRLVVSISKKWMGRSFAAGNGEGARTVNLYSGGWDRPSLDEVIQEGVLGLARAVDKFDPSRGLRFSTYSTHWITSYVRQCFQTASTGCLKVPAQLHEIKNSYRLLVKQYVESSEPVPSEEAIAAEIGVTLNRLRTAIRATEALLSIDEPVFNGGNAAYKGSGAGGDNSGESTLLVLDRLQCNELPPEDYVEIGFLRQTLENAMAAELSPHERDIVRLRLGLDDGQTRTVREVVDACGGGISVSDVRAAERRALKKLRSPNALHAHNLVEYLDMLGVDLDNQR